MRPEQVQRMNVEGIRALQAARDMIREASQHWLGPPEYLERTGLGSDPKLIQ
jgi:hypothetical protein